MQEQRHILTICFNCLTFDAVFKRTIMNKFSFWLDNARKIALPQSLLPCITAIVLSIGEDGFFWPFILPVVLGVAAGHLGMNLADDYFDYRKGLPSGKIRSRLVAEGSVRARMEKCSYIQSGDASEKDLLRAVLCFLGFAAIMGLAVVAGQLILNGWKSAAAVAACALAALVLGTQYSGGPLRLGYHGFGELVIGLMFGPLIMTGVHSALTGGIFRADLTILSIGVGCMVTDIVYVHSMMETSADRELGKFTFAHLLGGKRMQISALAVMTAVPFLCIAANVAFFGWSILYLAVFAVLPMSVSLIVSTWKFVNNLPHDDVPRWWMGPMGNWDAYVAAGIDWFLFRWLMARNATTFYCLIVIVVFFIDKIF